MDLQMKTESTLTRHVSRPSEPEATQDGGAERRFPPREEFLSGGQTLDIPLPDSPPEHLLLDVVMTFAEGAVRLDAPGVGVSVEGNRIQEAFRSLVAAVEDYVASANGEQANLAHYASHTWFRFVTPDQSAFEDKATLADGITSVLNQLYEFKGDMVKGFLGENLSLSGPLFEAYEVIRKHFGPEVEAALEVVADPEALGDQQLFVLIRTELPRKEARAHLAELDRGWWLNALPATEGKMEIALA